MIEGVSLVIPAYNEEGAVGSVVRAFHAALEVTGTPYEILVVDDGSTDATAQEARVTNAKVVQSPQNLGYGLALRRGILAAKHPYVMICDADGTYSPSAVTELVGLAENFDMVVAARTGRYFRGWGLRALARVGLRLFASFVVGRRIPDVNSGFRVFRKVDCLRYFGILSPGFSFTTGLTLAMISDARAVAFVPVDYGARVGRSKVRLVRDTLRIAQVLVQAMVRHNPIKLFSVITTAIWLLALVALVVWVVLGAVAVGLIAAATFLIGVQVFSVGLLAEALRDRRDA
ncbi:MAG: glycosyltransferase family 2 protein [Chloroflexota bacterium]|nr:glycosyltransferase family 2 protein [Chloroflexota bacterium]MDE2918786.1 glycosyltransferase family 2 protein [Chloroflexota bacterium]